jgi:glyoxylase-like metal-dependent hydrolase (beta-lactamase superfamily II)
MTGPDWRGVARQTAFAFVGTATFPRLAHRLRWPTRLGPRGLVAYIAFNTLLLVAFHTWVIPYFKRMAEEQERAKAELRRQLGREPTDDELFARLGSACKL